jgi:hypothetical protein
MGNLTAGLTSFAGPSPLADRIAEFVITLASLPAAL